MKNLVKFLFCLLSGFICAQKYISIDDLKGSFQINKFTLKTNALYAIDREVEIYNVFLSENIIMLFSVLPDLEPHGGNWVGVDKSTVKEKMVTGDQLLSLASDWLLDNKPENKTLAFSVVKKVGDNYFASKNCLAELFRIQDTESPIIPVYGTINVSEQKLTIKEMEALFKRQFPNSGFVLDPREPSTRKDISDSYMKKYYLSKQFKIRDIAVYQFWTFDGWETIDGLDEHRGIDRFVYAPAKGIVGGSYDFWFSLKPKISSSQYFMVDKNILWNNILNEKVMIAEELK